METYRATDGAATVLENARIYTMDHDLPQAEAIAWRDGVIISVGRLEAVRQAAGPGARRVDAGGRAVIPGLIDAHIHFLSYSRSLLKVDLDGAASKQEAVARVAEKVRDAQPGRWVLGGGWNHHNWSPPDFPTKEDLNRIAPDNPVIMDRKDLHSCWLNSLALRRAGITRDTPDPPGAAIGRDAAGEPNGLLFESATHLAHGAVDEPRDEPVELLRGGMRALSAMGLVGLHAPEGPEVFGALQSLDTGGELALRVVYLLTYARLDEAIGIGLKAGFGSERLRVGQVKIFSDGSLGSITAEMLEPYEGHPGDLGIGTIPQDELESAIIRAAGAGIPSAVHAIGDAANRRVLNAFAKAREREREQPEHALPLVHRIEHAQLLHPADIPRFASLGVVASMQPIHATSDMFAADRLWGARARYGYAWRSVLAAGGLVAFGSDAPVETPDPFKGIHAAVTRQNARNEPPGGWYPEERLTVEEAVRAYTEAAARSAPYLPGVTGTLTRGSVADMLVLDRDIFQVEPEELEQAHALATIVGGRATHDAGSLLG